MLYIRSSEPIFHSWTESSNPRPNIAPFLSEWETLRPGLKSALQLLPPSWLTHSGDASCYVLRTIMGLSAPNDEDESTNGQPVNL